MMIWKSAFALKKRSDRIQKMRDIFRHHASEKILFSLRQRDILIDTYLRFQFMQQAE